MEKKPAKNPHRGEVIHYSGQSMTPGVRRVRGAGDQKKDICLSHWTLAFYVEKHGQLFHMLATVTIDHEKAGAKRGHS